MRRRRRPWGYVPRGQEHHLAGVLAQHDGQCWVCDQPIFRLASQVVRRRGEWVHATCTPGADDV